MRSTKPDPEASTTAWTRSRITVIANVLRYERRHNPDGQVQVVNGQQPDALSNPFAMTWSRFGLFVAGLVLKNGHLYASAWSIAGFLGIPHAGQVVRVREAAFS